MKISSMRYLFGHTEINQVGTGIGLLLRYFSAPVIPIIVNRKQAYTRILIQHLYKDTILSNNIGTICTRSNLNNLLGHYLRWLNHVIRFALFGTHNEICIRLCDLILKKTYNVCHEKSPRQSLIKKGIWGILATINFHTKIKQAQERWWYDWKLRDI